MTTADSTNRDQPSVRLPESEQLFCGFVIDEQGQERAITEAMIREACLALEQAAITGLHAHLPR